MCTVLLPGVFLSAGLEMTSVTSFSVATGLYLEYWRQQATDADERLFPDGPLQLLVFTDRPEEAQKHAATLNRATVTVIPVESMGWPAATMRRYELITTFASHVQGEVLMHLDADMRIPGIVGPSLDSHGWRGNIALVKHPGYFRSRSFTSRLFSNPRTALSDVRGFIRGESGIGKWERRPQSLAYVEARKRCSYVCGGVWFGTTASLLAMCSMLAQRMEGDESRGITARWHDESYLNWYAANYEVTLLDPSYCYIPGLSHESGLRPLITAVDKQERRVRSGNP
jgi:hypothetical protein